MIELLALALMRAQIAAAFGVVLVLLLRLPVRQLFEARLAYGLWIIAPAAAIASLFPSLSESLEVGATTAPMGSGVALTGVALWLAGAGLYAAFVVRQERAFRCLADRGEAGPAVMGALWPRLVLPADFEDRFSARERELILLHERTHIRRGDPMANLIVAGCRALGWCNPMVHLGAALLRIDQELACDAGVLAVRTGIRADYARALLKVSMVGSSSPLACGWATHPLILRVGFVGRTEPSRRREIVGFLAVTILALASVVGVWMLAPRGFDQHAFAPDALYAASFGQD